MIQIQFNHEKHVISSTWKDAVNLQDIFEYINKLSELRCRINCLYIIQDVTRSEILINPTDDLQNVVSRVFTKLSGFKTIYMAHVVNEPHQTVLSFFY